MSLNGWTELHPGPRGVYLKIERLMPAAYVVAGLLGAGLLHSMESDRAAVAFFAGTMVLMVFGYGLQALVRRRTRIAIVGDELHYVGLMGTKVLGRRGEGKAVALRLDWKLLGRQATPEQRVFLDADGAPVAPRVAAFMWDVEAVDRMCDQLRIPRFVEPQPLTSQQVLDRYAPELAARIGSLNASPRFLFVIFVIAGVITALGYLR